MAIPSKKNNFLGGIEMKSLYNLNIVNFSEIDNYIRTNNINNLGGVLADLGCSSHQFDCPERGFSYSHEARLDMRMQQDAPLSAFEVINTYSEERLKSVIFEYGEERFAPRIARAICQYRDSKPIVTTTELSEIIKKAIR